MVTGYFGIGGAFGNGRSRIFNRPVDQTCGRLVSLIEFVSIYKIRPIWLRQKGPVLLGQSGDRQFDFLRAWGVRRGSANTSVALIKEIRVA